MAIEAEMLVERPWVDRVNGIAVAPAMAPPNTLGLRSVMFTVESVDECKLCYMRGAAGMIVALAEELFCSEEKLLN